MDKLVNFKQIHDEVDKATRSSGTNIPSHWSFRRLEVARKDLAPPPFLVFAVVEALFNSHHAAITWVVSGEADPFCAVAARNTALSNPEASVTIFTNDSDLIIYNSGPQTKVAMINSVEERDHGNGKVLEALQFWPQRLTNLGPTSLPDLIRPAYEMQAPVVSFREALSQSQFHVGTTDYKEFANSYSLDRPTVELEHLKARRERKKDILQTDARISELVRQAMNELRRLNKAKEDRAARESETKVISLRDVTSQDNGEENLMSESQFETGQNDQTLSEFTPVDLHMYLPMLFEDPSRGSAWRVGGLFRSAAESFVLEMFELNSLLFEYRKSGNGLNTNRLKNASLYDASKRFTAWTDYLSRELQLEQHLNSVHRWRFLVMQLTLVDMIHESIALPHTQDVVNILNGTPPKTWNEVHFLAEYQAEYYSLRMLKEVLHYLRPTASSGLTEEHDLYEQLGSLPSVAQFFNPESEGEQPVGEVRWQILAGDFLNALDPTPVRMPKKRSKGGKPQKKRKGSPKEVLGVTSEEEEVVDPANPFSALAEE